MRRGAVVCFVLAMSAAAVAQLPAVNVESFLPVHSATLRVGSFVPRRAPTGVSRPFFLVGCDEVSLAWVRKNRERLIALEAFGLVVEAPDARAYRRLEVIADGLVLRPVVGDVMAKHLRIEAYPVLITAEGFFP